jgi:hypothetical protein
MSWASQATTGNDSRQAVLQLTGEGQQILELEGQPKADADADIRRRKQRRRRAKLERHWYLSSNLMRFCSTLPTTAQAQQRDAWPVPGQQQG